MLLLRGLASLVVPVFRGDPVPFGPRPAWEVLSSLLAMTVLCAAVGHKLTRSTLLLRLARPFQADLRDEAWEELKSGAGEDAEVHAEEEGQKEGRRPIIRKRTATELLFISVHNAAVATLAALAWVLGSPSLAVYAFNLEVAYEIFDAYSLGLKRLEPESIVHHLVSPICILCSMQTEVDFRVLCHLCICIDASGAVLGYSKFLLRYAHVSASQVYRKLSWIYGITRVVLSLVDTAIIVWTEIVARGGLFRLVTTIEHGTHPAFNKTDWTQLYFWAMAVLNAFNLYFFLVIRTRAHMPPHLVARLEAQTGCR